MYNYAWKEGGVAVGDKKEGSTIEIPTKIQGDFVEFEALENNRRELFDRLEKETVDLAPEVRQALVARVIEHSPKDGMELATQLGLSPAEIIRSLAGRVLLEKHFDFAVKLTKIWDRNARYIDLEKTEKVKITNMFSGRIKSSDFDLKNKWQERLPEQVRPLAENIDDYYAQFLAKRKLVSLDEEKKLVTEDPFIPKVESRDRSAEPTKTEKSGERVLQWLEDARQGRYYAEPVRKALWRKMFGDDEYDAEKLEKAIEKFKFNESVAHEIMHEPLVPKPTIAGILLIHHNPKLSAYSQSIINYASGHPEEVKIVNEFLTSLGPSAEWKPYSIMVKGEASHAQSTLIKELNASLITRYGEGVKIAPNSQTGKYEVKDGRADTEIKFEQKKYEFNFDLYKFDKKVQPQYDSVDSPTEINGQLAYVAQQGDKQFIVLNGQPQAQYDYVGSPTEINGQLAYWARQGDKRFIVLNGQPQAQYDSVGSPTEINGQLAYWARQGDKQFIVLNGQPQVQYDYVDSPTEINGQLAYQARQGDKQFIVLNGQPQAQYDSVDSPTEINGQLAYQARQGDKWFIVLNGQPQAQYDSVGLPTEINGQLTYRARQGDKWLIVYGHSEIRIKGELLSFNFDNNLIMVIVQSNNQTETYTYKLEELSQNEKSDSINLTEKEQRDLELLNLLAGVQAGKFDGGAVFDYFRKYYPTDKKMSLKDQVLNFVAHSKRVVKTLNDTLKEEPKLFLSTMGAKQDNLSEAYVEHLLISLFPEIRVNREREERAEGAKSGRFGNWGGFGREALAQVTEDPEVSVKALLSGAEYTAFEGADPKNEREAEVVRLREPVAGMLVSGIYGRYNSSSRKWEKIPLDLSREDSGVTREITMEISDTRSLHEVVLPRLSSGKILSDRVKGVAQDGQEVTLDTKTNRFGESVVAVPSGINRILYSQTEDLVPKVPTDCRTEQYEKFKRQVERGGGEALTEKLTRLPDEMKMFLDSLRSRSPKEQLQAVEAFVRRYGYYDFDNVEVIKEKQGKSLEEILSIMEIRLQELRRRPDLSEALNNKKYAGVCADFALMASAMMRELGIPSGVISGFRLSPEQKSVTTKQAHGIAFALWPSIDGKAEIIEVDGTPHGVTAEQEALLATFRKPSLLEKEKQTEEMSQMIFKANEAKLHEFEKILAENDLEKIESLSNGELEKVLNALLANVHEPHYHIIQTVLDAGRYAGFDVAKLRKEKNLETELAFQRFLESEITRERQVVGDLSTKTKFSRGSELLDLVHNFAERYVKDGKGTVSYYEAFETVKKMIETAGNKLDPLEARATIAIIQYLEALKI